MHEGVGIEGLRPALGRPQVPGGLEEGHEPRIVERQDRFESVFGGSLDRESVVSLEVAQDRFCSVRHVGRGALHTRFHGIRRNQPLVLRAVDDLHDDVRLTAPDTVGSLRCDAWAGRHERRPTRMDRPCRG